MPEYIRETVKDFDDWMHYGNSLSFGIRSRLWAGPNVKIPIMPKCWLDVYRDLLQSMSICRKIKHSRVENFLDYSWLLYLKITSVFCI